MAALILLQPNIDRISDSLIAGNDAGLSELLRVIVNATTGPLGASLPAPLRAFMSVTAPILNLIKNCKNGPTSSISPPDPTNTQTGGPNPNTNTDGLDYIVTNGPPPTAASSAVATTTPIPNCFPLIGPIKDVISQAINTVENLPLGPEASQLLKLALGTNLSSYFDNSIDAVGSTAAILAATIPQIIIGLKNTQSSQGPILNIADPIFQIMYDILGQLTKAFADLAACTGANVDCTGLVILLGYAINIGVPIIRAYLAVKFPRKFSFLITKLKNMFCFNSPSVIVNLHISSPYYFFFFI